MYVLCVVKSKGELMRYNYNLMIFAGHKNALTDIRASLHLSDRFLHDQY